MLEPQTIQSIIRSCYFFDYSIIIPHVINNKLSGNIVDKSGITPFMFCLSHNDLKNAKILLQKYSISENVPSFTSLVGVIQKYSSTNKLHIQLMLQDILSRKIANQDLKCVKKYLQLCISFNLYCCCNFILQHYNYSCKLLKILNKRIYNNVQFVNNKWIVVQGDISIYTHITTTDLSKYTNNHIPEHISDFYEHIAMFLRQNKYKKCCSCFYISKYNDFNNFLIYNNLDIAYELYNNENSIRLDYS